MSGHPINVTATGTTSGSAETSIAFGELATLKDALDKRREFEAEITTALRWAEIGTGSPNV